MPSDQDFPRNAKYTAPTIRSIDTTVFHFGYSRKTSAANTRKTASVMHSWAILSWVTLKRSWPIRLAGTWKMYSKRAIPQLRAMAQIRGRFASFRWPYQAIVMKVLEISKRPMNLAAVD